VCSKISTYEQKWPILPALRYRRADQKHKQGDRLAAERVFPTVNGKLKRSACCRNPEDNNGRGGFIERRYCLQCWILMYDFGIACMFCRLFYQLNNIYTTSFTCSRFIYITLSLSLSLSSLFLSLSLYTIYIYRVSKNCAFCFCQNFVKIAPIVLHFGRWMAKGLKLYTI